MLEDYARRRGLSAAGTGSGLGDGS